MPKMEELKKETLAKTYENINRLLKTRSGEHDSKINYIVNSAEYSNPVEKSIRLIIVDLLRSKENIIRALLSDDIVQIRRALKCQWFFEDALTPTFYKTKIFPKVSYSTRCKIINQLAKNMKKLEHVEELFEFIQQNYGKKFAVVFLPKCSSKFISTYIDEYKSFLFNERNIKTSLKLIEKYPDIILPFLGMILQKQASSKRILLCLQKYYPNIFLTFFENYYSNLAYCFGAKLTRKSGVRLYKIMLALGGKDPKKLFKQSTLFKYLDFQGKIDFIASFIKFDGKDDSFKNWCSELHTMLGFVRYRPCSERVKLLEAVFNQVYKKDLWDHPKSWRKALLELMPLDIREKCIEMLSSNLKDADIVLKGDIFDPRESMWWQGHTPRKTADKMIYLESCEVSIPKLTAISKKALKRLDRETLIVEMAKSCGINKDLVHLKKVCKYVADITTQHRKDDFTLIGEFLSTVQKYFNHKTFDLAVWNALEELSAIYLLRAEDNLGIEENLLHLGTLRTEENLFKWIRPNYILSRLENNLCAKEEVRSLIKLAAEKEFFVRLLLFKCNPENPHCKTFYRLVLEEYCRVAEEADLAKEDVMDLFPTIMGIIVDYNERYKKDRIQVGNFKILLKHLDKMAEKSELEPLYDFLWSDPYLRQRYSPSVLLVSFKCSLFCKLLKRNPNYVKNNLGKILEMFFDRFTDGNIKKMEGYFIHNRKIFDFLNLSEEIRNITMETFKSSESSYRKLTALKLYSCFGEINEFQKLVHEYEPKSMKIDYKTGNGDFLKIQTAVPELIHKMKPDSKNLEYIFKFMGGDFLKHVIYSFNSACYNSPVDFLVPILKEKMNNSADSKKYILSNISEIFSLREREKMELGLGETEKGEPELKLCGSVFIREIKDIV